MASISSHKKDILVCPEGVFLESIAGNQVIVEPFGPNIGENTVPNFAFQQIVFILSVE